MRPAPFRYFAPRSLEEARTLLAEYGEEGRPLAGGQSLVPLMNLRLVRPSVLVDLNRVAGLDTIALDGGQLVVGAMVRQRDCERSPLVTGHCPLVASALGYAGPLAVRNRATVGGTLAHADRTAELPGVAAALEADFVIESPGGRRIVTAADFFQGDLTTAVQPGEMLSAVRFPVQARGEFSAFLESGTRQRDMVVAGLAVCIRQDRGTWHQARVAAVGVASTPLRLRALEAALVSDGPASPSVMAAARDDVAAIDMVSDVHATADYRSHLLLGLIEKAVSAVRSEAA